MQGRITQDTVNIPRAATRTAAAAKSLQSCPTLCDPIDSSLPGSPVPGILQIGCSKKKKGGGHVEDQGPSGLGREGLVIVVALKAFQHLVA